MRQFVSLSVYVKIFPVLFNPEPFHSKLVGHPPPPKQALPVAHQQVTCLKSSSEEDNQQFLSEGKFGKFVQGRGHPIFFRGGFIQKFGKEAEGLLNLLFSEAIENCFPGGFHSTRCQRDMSRSHTLTCLSRTLASFPVVCLFFRSMSGAMLLGATGRRFFCGFSAGNFDSFSQFEFLCLKFVELFPWLHFHL